MGFFYWLDLTQVTTAVVNSQVRGPFPVQETVLHSTFLHALAFLLYGVPVPPGSMGGIVEPSLSELSTLVTIARMPSTWTGGASLH